MTTNDRCTVRAVTNQDPARVCTYTMSPLTPGDRIAECNQCGSVMLADAWDENGGCSSMGCSNAPDFRKDAPALRVEIPGGNGPTPPSLPQGSRHDPAQIRAVGLAQRMLMWAVLSSLLVLAGPIGYLISLPFQLYSVYRLAEALRMGSAVLYMLAMFIPLVSVLCLLNLNAKATSLLREAGIKVGLMGPNPDHLP